MAGVLKEMASHIKVVIAIPVLLLGGTETQTLALVKILLLARYQITVCCYYEYDPAIVSQIEKTGARIVLMRLQRSDGMWYLVKKLRILLKEIRPDIVHVQYIAPGLVPIIAARLAEIRKIFATVHQPGRTYGLKEKLLINIALTLCTAFFCNSKAVEKSWFGDCELFTPDTTSLKRKHFTIYNSVDIDSIEKIAKNADREKIKESLDVGNKKVIGVVGRLRSEKGQALLLNAMVDVIKVFPDSMLLVVGDGPDRMSLELRAKSLGLASNILWFGQKSSEEVYRLYSIMDIVAVPSVFEGFGLVAAEAMAAGLPVVATKIDGLTEVVEDNKTGYLVPEGDSEALASALLKLLSNRTWAREMGLKGQARVRELFSMEKFSKAILGAYRELA